MSITAPLTIWKRHGWTRILRREEANKPFLISGINKQFSGWVRTWKKEKAIRDIFKKGCIQDEIFAQKMYTKVFERR